MVDVDIMGYGQREPLATHTVRDTLRVAEVFAPAIQGEGPYTGRACAFVRLMGCNLSCSWCDTAWTWDNANYDVPGATVMATPGEIMASIPEGTNLVVISGGEPLLQQHTDAWRHLLHGIRHDLGALVQVETNGTLAPDTASRNLVDTWVVSPKLANAGSHRGKQDPTMNPEWARLAYRGDVHLKVVCSNAADVEKAAAWADELGWPAGKLWVMPEGKNAAWLEAVWPPVAEAARRLGINASHRLHVLAWGEVKGR